MEKTIAVVGTRKITPYGKMATEKIVTSLVRYGFTIVSGMAYGVDAVAHKTAMSCGGKTVAVLGCGVDIIAPPSNRDIYEEIISGRGAVVSEMPLSLRPGKGLFPARNRIISGMSLGVVVVEGAQDSGSLITARCASEQGRDVFAVPGPITSPYSRATASLIKNGAKLVESAEDIIDEFGMDKLPKPTASLETVLSKTKNVIEQKIIRVIFGRSMTPDQIVRELESEVKIICPALTMLELNGVVDKLSDGQYVLR